MSAPANVVELLQALVRIPSVNPEGDPGAPPAQCGEQACAEFVAEFLRQAGARVEMQPVYPGRPNVIGIFPGGGPGKKRVYLAPHLDTVGIAGMTIAPFSGKEEEGKIWGRGASDTKGSMAAMLWALWEMREEIAALSHEIWFVGLMGEETGQYGSKAFVKEYGAENPGESFALVGEPTGATIVHAHKGSCWLNLTTRGVAMHGSAPDSGVNAIYKMQEVIAWLRGTLGPRFAGIVNPVLGSPTFNVGTIRGGSRTNIVPDFCEMTVDLRMTPELYETGSTPFGARLLSELRRDVDPGLEGTYRESTPLWTDPAHPLVAALERAGKHCGGASWFCDAAVFAAGGIPAVAAGPGSIVQAHTRDEWITVDALREGVAFYRRFLQQL